jgi:hypothetical protein
MILLPKGWVERPPTALKIRQIETEVKVVFRGSSPQAKDCCLPGSKDIISWMGFPVAGIL